MRASIAATVTMRSPRVASVTARIAASVTVASMAELSGAASRPITAK